MTQHARSGSLQPAEDGTQHPAPLWHEQTQVRQYSSDSPVVPQDPAEALPVALTESGAELDQSATSRRFSRRTGAGALRYPAEALPVALTESGAELDQSAKSRRFSRRTVAGARRPSW